MFEIVPLHQLHNTYIWYVSSFLIRHMYCMLHHIASIKLYLLVRIGWTEFEACICYSIHIARENITYALWRACEKRSNLMYISVSFIFYSITFLRQRRRQHLQLEPCLRYIRVLSTGALTTRTTNLSPNGYGHFDLIYKIEILLNINILILIDIDFYRIWMVQFIQ